jgi:uracil-DNA glycosylase
LALSAPPNRQRPSPRDYAIAASPRDLALQREDQASLVGFERELELVGMPKKVLALGTTAGKALTGDPRPIEQLRLLRPTPSPHLDDTTEVRVTYHPSALPRNPEWPGQFDGDVGWLGGP